MKAVRVTGYARKPKKALIKAIDDCVSLSQLFALIQHENITLQMHSQPGASNLVPKTLSPKEQKCIFLERERIDEEYICK